MKLLTRAVLLALLIQVWIEVCITGTYLITRVEYQEPEIAGVNWAYIESRQISLSTEKQELLPSGIFQKSH